MSLQSDLTDIFSQAFERAGHPTEYGQVQASKIEGTHFQCNGALALASELKTNPRQIAQQVIDQVGDQAMFQDLNVAGPGFINIVLTDATIASYAQAMRDDARLGVPPVDAPRTVVIDYGGPNVAKPMHVGHLRSSVLGESLKRIFRFYGENVIGDIHLGDWGTQMGMVIEEIKRRQPDLPYFDSDFTGSYPAQSPVTVDELTELYPTANQRCNEDPAAMEAARQATAELQSGRPGYRALWQHLVDISIEELKKDFGRLGVDFDLWYGESSVHDRIPPMIDYLRDNNYAQESEGALIMDVSLPGDNFELPPMVLLKSDGSALYSTTDMATIDQRVKELDANLILYVVDARQSDHFKQVFRAASKSQIAPPHTEMEHLAFGTVNGTDGKPLKTRAGGVMRLSDLMQTLVDKAMERLTEIEEARDEQYGTDEKLEIATKVGLAALKFGDLINQRTRDYTFDLDRFVSFEGKTGPYLLYTVVRIKSILRKAAERDLEVGAILPPQVPIERDLLLYLLQMPHFLGQAYETRLPHFLAEYTYNLANLFSKFYEECHILREEDAERRASLLGISELSLATFEVLLPLLGIDVVERM